MRSNKEEYPSARGCVESCRIYSESRQNHDSGYRSFSFNRWLRHPRQNGINIIWNCRDRSYFFVRWLEIKKKTLIATCGAIYWLISRVYTIRLLFFFSCYQQYKYSLYDWCNVRTIIREPMWLCKIWYLLQIKYYLTLNIYKRLGGLAYESWARVMWKYIGN